ncbi:unnamed protein product [marine sediment metagenome]|uniref:Uncharacterized protein n=1 Tax=marine sediment metagenome TaxID=412755 RepID=X0VY72_9ZZZZ
MWAPGFHGAVGKVEADGTETADEEVRVVVADGLASGQSGEELHAADWTRLVGSGVVDDIPRSVLDEMLEGELHVGKHRPLEIR